MPNFRPNVMLKVLDNDSFGLSLTLEDGTVLILTKYDDSAGVEVCYSAAGSTVEKKDDASAESIWQYLHDMTV